MLKFIELIKSEKENILRNLSGFLYKALCIRNNMMYAGTWYFYSSHFYKSDKF